MRFGKLKQELAFFHGPFNEICANCGKPKGEHNSYAWSLFNIDYCFEESLKTKRGPRFKSCIPKRSTN